MAKPRIFVSSTYYDLRYIRAAMEEFIFNIGYEPVLFEKGSIPFHHDKLLEEACLGEIDSSDIVVLIIGGRYGSLSIEDTDAVAENPIEFYDKIRSVTRKEYERARLRAIPIFIFVESAVLNEYKTFQKNRSNDKILYANVDDVRVFHLIEDIFKQRLNNFVKGFDKTNEIIIWLREQWAGLFADHLRRRHEDVEISSLKFQISQLTSVVQSLQAYTESLVRSNSDQGEELITIQQLRQKSNLADAVIDADPVRWFVSHPDTEKYFDVKSSKRRKEILDFLYESEGLIDFLDQCHVPSQAIVNSMVGVEDSLNSEYAMLLTALKSMKQDTDVKSDN